MVNNSLANAGDAGLISQSERGGNYNLLKYSALENLVNRGAWWATVRRVEKSQTQRQLSIQAHSQLEAESRAITIIFGELAYRSYINIMLPFNCMWKIGSFTWHSQKTRSHPYLGFHCALWAFSEKDWSSIDVRVCCEGNHVFTLRPAKVGVGLVVHFIFASTWEKAMAPHSSTLAWKIPWTEEPGKLQSMGSLRVGHNWATSLSLFTFMHWRRKWQPTPVFLPGESQGRGSLVGCRLWGRTESDTTEVT